MWYVGLDWAETHHDVDVLDETGKRVGARRFSHSPEGLNELKQFLLSFVTRPEELACVIETAHGLLIAFLRIAQAFPCIRSIRNWPISCATLLEQRPIKLTRICWLSLAA
jgi:hypothetical protein